MSSPLLKSTTLAMLAASGFVVLLGSLLNHRGQKYSYSSRRDSQCAHYVVNLYQEDSDLCCDAYHHGNDLVCQAVFDKTARRLASPWAFLLPLLPALITSLVDLFLVTIIPTPSPEGAGQNSLQKPSLLRRIRLSLPSLHLQRYVTYLLVIAFRVVVLYLIPEALVDMLYAQGFFPLSPPCWCPEFVSAKKCMLRFDYSDHIVLIVVQYLLPLCLEVAFLRFNRLDSGQSNLHSKIGAWKWLYYLPVAAITILGLACLKAVFFTALFFHTPTESLVGWTISCAFVLLFASKASLSRVQVMPRLHTDEVR